MSGELWLIDASAFVKLIWLESESDTLSEWASGHQLVSSDLLRTEARRAVAGTRPEVLQRCEHLLTATPLIALTPEVLDEAGRLADPGLRSLDAIYLASARLIGDDLGGLVSYDTRQLAAAHALGIITESPGLLPAAR